MAVPKVKRVFFHILEPTTAATTTTTTSTTTTTTLMSCDVEVGVSYKDNFLDHEEAEGQKEFDEMDKCRSHCTSIGAEYFNWWGPKSPALSLKCYCKTSLDGTKVETAVTTDVHSGTVYSKSHIRRILR